MNRILLIISSLFLLTQFYTFAQDSSIRGVKYWNEGPLVKEDFSTRIVGDKDIKNIGKIECSLEYKPEKVKIGNLKYTHFKTYLYMDKLNSWIDPTKYDALSLRYYQASFDRAEITRREFQNDLDSPKEDKDDNYTIIEYYERLLRSRSDAFAAESINGTNEEVIARFEKENQELLASVNERPLMEPHFTKKAFGVGLYAGYYGEMFVGGASSSALPMLNGFNFGINVPYNSAYFAFDMNLGFGGKLKEDNFYYDPKEDYNWQKGKNYKGGNLMLLAGYTLMDSPKSALTPFFGAGIAFLDQATGEVVEEQPVLSEINGLKIEAGVQFGYKLSRSLNTTSGKRGEYAESSLKFKLYGAMTRNKNLGGFYSINFGVVWDGTTWILK